MDWFPLNRPFLSLYLCLTSDTYFQVPKTVRFLNSNNCPTPNDLFCPSFFRALTFLHISRANSSLKKREWEKEKKKKVEGNNLCDNKWMLFATKKFSFKFIMSRTKMLSSDCWKRICFHNYFPSIFGDLSTIVVPFLFHRLPFSSSLMWFWISNREIPYWI